MTLTIQILIKNNADTIERCLNSIANLGKIIVINVGSTDKTPDICEKMGHKCLQSNSKDYSQLRNSYLSKSWNLYIHPHEFLVNGQQEIKDIATTIEKQSFLVKIVQGTIVSKEIRLWNKSLQFNNPTYEKVTDPQALDAQEILIYSDQHKMDLEERLEIIKDWKLSRPTAIEPYYYHALTLLLQGKYPEFTVLAEHYLFKDKSSQSSVMLRYYLAMVQAYQLDNFNEAIKNTLTCISFKPKMAEFWCLLGDIHYLLKEHNKATEFYQNAIILGSQRLQSDRWPLDISKYKTHPTNVIENIKKTTSEIKIYREATKYINTEG